MFCVVRATVGSSLRRTNAIYNFQEKDSSSEQLLYFLNCQCSYLARGASVFPQHWLAFQSMYQLLCKKVWSTPLMAIKTSSKERHIRSQGFSPILSCRNCIIWEVKERRLRGSGKLLGLS